MSIITMKSSLVLCVLLGAVLSVRAASVSPSVEAVTLTSPVTAMSETSYVTEPEDFNQTTNTWTTPNLPMTTRPCCISPSPSPTTQTTTYPTTQGPPSPNQMMCPDGWEVFQGRCYYFVNEGMTWPQAQSNCAMLESMLVSVHSAQEYGFLQQLTNSHGNQDAWLGGFYLQDQWLWIDGSWFYNNSWSNEYPYSSNPCLMLNSYEAWSNSPCNAGGYSSICVKPSNVPPAMLCPEGWTGFLGRCYYYNDESLTWPAADTNCATLEASLVSIHSPEEYAFLYHQSTVNGFSPTWLGGFYLEDQWIWLDGSWFYQGFFTQMSADSSYPCLSTYSADGWSNYECDQTFPSFCVKNAVV